MVLATTPTHVDGTFSEYVTVPSSYIAPKPANLSHKVASTVPYAALTAWSGLFFFGGMQPGQKVLVHGAAGGVGMCILYSVRSDFEQVFHCFIGMLK